MKSKQLALGEFDIQNQVTELTIKGRFTGKIKGMKYALYLSLCG